MFAYRSVLLIWAPLPAECIRAWEVVVSGLTSRVSCFASEDSRMVLAQTFEWPGLPWLLSGMTLAVLLTEWSPVGWIRGLM